MAAKNTTGRGPSQHKKSRSKTRDQQVVWSLFSGAMGLDLGLESVGLPCSVAVEIDRYACATIRKNRDNLTILEEDVRGVTGERLRQATGYSGDVFLLAGGPPCQSFSPGGKRASLRDPRGNLIYEFFRLVREVQPQHFLFENVANILTAAIHHRPIAQRPGKHWNLSVYDDHVHANDGAAPMEAEELSGSAIISLLNDLADLDYDFSFMVLNAAEYGAPQHRLRFVMLGSRDGPPPAFPAPTHGNGIPFSTVHDAIHDLQKVPGPGSQYTAEVKRFFDLVPPGGNWRSLPGDLQRDALGKAFNSGGGKTGFFRRLSWDAPSPTITGRANRKGAALCHPTQTRPLAVHECARIQGFNDDWTFAGSMAQQYVQIGNAVPVHLGAAIGKALIENKPSPPVDQVVLLEQAVLKLRRAAHNKLTGRGRTAREQLSFGYA